MMDTSKKNTIMVIVAVVLLTASGWVLYTGVFSGPGSAPVTATSNFSTGGQQIVNLLPYGNTLSFEAIENRKDVGRSFQYKLVNPDTDVGLETADLVRNIIPAPLSSPQSFLRPADDTNSLFQNR